MVIRTPYRSRVKQAFIHSLRYAAVLSLAGLPMALQLWQGDGAGASLPNYASDNSVSISLAASEPTVAQPLLPTILSQQDIALYQAAFRAQKKNDIASADAAIAQISNPILMGHVLAERYLSRRYNPTEAEATAWLDQYSDHPQAAEIYAIAITRNPANKASLPIIRKQASLEGHGDDNGLAALAGDTPYAHTWHAGMQAWRIGHKQEAAKFFSSIAKHGEELSPWTLSAAAYWAYRSYDAVGDKAQADNYLRLAASEPRSFYGILARKKLRQPLDLDSNPVKLTDSDVLQMVGDHSIRRTVALAQADLGELAEKELRARFPQDDSEKPRLLALAHELGLASVQISMAKQMARDGHELDFARYPIPSWEPAGGFKVDPLLLFALMRQESGFHPSAVSPSGALGLMQLMPDTASRMQKTTSTIGNAADPIQNITLGQNYVAHLLGNELVEGNLFYLLTAYNAGPGRLQEWKDSIGHKDDPLLFVESIPFPQTRFYVMQVMTNYWIYSEMIGGSNHTIYALLKGSWPSYNGYTGAVAQRSVAKHAG